MSFCLDIDEDNARYLLDTANTGISQCIERAGKYLLNAVLIWQMIDPEKAVRLKRLMDEELKTPLHKVEVRLHPEQIERFIELLRDIETTPIGKIMNKDYVVLPEKIDYVNEHAPGLAVRTADGKGNIIYVLDRITEITWLRAFLETALELKCDVIYD